MPAGRDASEFVQCAVLGSLFADPTSPYLTETELVDLGEQHGRRPGELRDALTRLPMGVQRSGDVHNAYRPDAVCADLMLYAGGLGHRPMPAPEILDFVIAEFRNQAAEVGQAHARLSRATLIARGAARGHAAHCVQTALTLLVLSGLLVARGDGLGPGPGITLPGFPRFVGREVEQPARGFVQLLQALLPAVENFIHRRSDGRARSPAPLLAFEAVWARMGYPNMKHWWAQRREELGRASDQQTPESMIVLCAALAEGALSAVVEHARKVGTTMTRVPPELRRWKFVTLIQEARTGSDPIVAEPLGKQCLQLNERRQRIHAATLLHATLAEIDVRPEQAREARTTGEALVRAVLEWLDRNPGT